MLYENEGLEVSSDDVMQGSQTQILPRAALAIKNVPRAAH